MLIRLNVIDRQGNKTVIDAEEGRTIREVVMEKLAPGNYGLCDGNCICGTCHIFVDPNDFKKFQKMEEAEVETLESLANKPSTYSRLGCQIELKKEHNNLTVTVVSDVVD